MPGTVLAVTDEAGKNQDVATGAWAKKAWQTQGAVLVLLVFISFFPRLFHIEEYLFFPFLVAAVGMVWWAKERMWVRTPLDLPLWLFIGWILVTVPFATDPGYSFAEWRKLLAQVLVFYWALLVLQRNSTDLLTRHVVLILALATAIVSAYGIFDFFGRGGTWRDRFVRAGAPSSDYNWLSTYMVIAIPFLAGEVFRNRPWKSVLYLVSLMLALVAHFISYTRAGWMGLVAQGISFSVLTTRRRLAVWILACGTLLGVGLVLLAHFGYQQSTVDPWTLNARFAVWKLEVSDVLAHPLMGVGYGSKTFMMRFGDSPEAEKADGPHSAFLMVAMGSGVPALVFLVWTLIRAIRTLAKNAGQMANSPRSGFMLAAAVMIVGFATRNLFDYMFAGSLAYLFWMLVAIGIAASTTECRTIPPS